MTPETVVDIIRHALMTTFWLSAPLLGVCVAAGIAMSLLQVVTSIQDSAFSTAPRLAAFLLGLVLFLPWIVAKLMAYTTFILGDLGRYAR
ncbi:MAG: flagellar biosynthetic protein FliQ [Bryobacteraceae bacterium]